MTSVFSWQNSVNLCPDSFCTPRSNCLTSYFCIPVPYDEMDIFFFFFFGGSSRRSCRSLQNHSTLASLALLVGAQTWITVILNGFPWKRMKIILLFLRLHPSTAFCTLFFFNYKKLLHLFKEILAHSSRYNGHLS